MQMANDAHAIQVASTFTEQQALVREYERNAARDNNIGNGPASDPFVYHMLRDVEPGVELFHA